MDERRKVRPEEMASMLGLEGTKPGRFTLWHTMKGNYTPEDHPGEVRRNKEIHTLVAEHVLKHPSLALKAQVNPKIRVHPELPIEGCADGIVREDARFGRGLGVAIIEEVTGHEWTRDWHDQNGVPMAPPAARTRMEGVFLLYRVEWGIVIPQVGWRQPYPPIIVNPDENTAQRTQARNLGYARVTRKTQGTSPRCSCRHHSAERIGPSVSTGHTGDERTE